ncbi:unnamed protein product [Camellia sinensis]
MIYITVQWKRPKVEKKKLKRPEKQKKRVKKAREY